MPLFDVYLAVDWSARGTASPKTPTYDALWVGERLACGAEDDSIAGETYWRTRHECVAYIRERLLHHGAAARRVLVRLGDVLGEKGAPALARGTNVAGKGRRAANPGDRRDGSVDHRHAAAVLRPTTFARLGADRTLLAIRDGVDPRGGNAETDEILLDRICAPRAQCKIVLARTAFVELAASLQTAGPLLYLAGLADPGNAGTLLRSAEIFGLGGAIVGTAGVECDVDNLRAGRYRLHAQRVRQPQVLATAAPRRPGDEYDLLSAQVGEPGTLMRDDEITNQPAPEEMLANAPARSRNFFKVPKIIE